jgi:NH3-dependent NAD+ synthetase
MNNLYKNSKQDILLSDTSITNTDTNTDINTNTDTNKYTVSILNSLLDNNIHSGGAFSPLSFLKPKSQLPSVHPAPPKIIYKHVTHNTEITPSERKQFEEFMLTNPYVKIDNISKMLEEYISELDKIKKILKIY